MSDLTQTIDRLHDAAANALNETLGSTEPAGVSNYSELALDGLALPLRVVRMSFASGLADTIALATTLPHESAVEACLAMATAMGDRFGVTAQLAEPEVHDLPARDQAQAQLEALHDEVMFDFACGEHRLLVILGSGLVQTAALLAADQTAASEEATSADLPISAPAQAQSPWMQVLPDVEVELSAELGSTTMQLGEVAGVETDTVLTLEQLVDEPVTVFVNGAPYAKAKLVVVDDEYGVEILELLEHDTAIF